MKILVTKGKIFCTYSLSVGYYGNLMVYIFFDRVFLSKGGVATPRGVWGGLDCEKVGLFCNRIYQ